MAQGTSSSFDRLKAQTIAPPGQLSGPTSLAHFIGGDRSVSNANNRLGLRKPSQDQDPNVAHLETDTGPVRTFLSGGQIALPGLASPSETKAASSKSQPPSPLNDQPDFPQKAASPQKSATFPLTTDASSQQSQRSWQSSNESAGPATSGHYTLGTPKQRFQDQAAQDRPEKATASLTRLRSSNLVKQRLDSWGEDSEDGPESPSKSNTHSATPATPSNNASPTKEPFKRTSVLDRWGRDEPDQLGLAAAADAAEPPAIKSPSPRKPIQTAFSPSSGSSLENMRTSPETDTRANSLASKFGDSANIPLPKVWPPPNRVSPSQSPSLVETSASATPSESPRSWMRSPQNMVLPSPSASRSASAAEETRPDANVHTAAAVDVTAPAPVEDKKPVLSHLTKDRAQGPRKTQRKPLPAQDRFNLHSSTGQAAQTKLSVSPEGKVTVPPFKIESVRYDFASLPLKQSYAAAPSKSTIDVEVHVIKPDGTSAPMSASEEGILHETELLAVLHHFKAANANGKQTEIFLWHGRQAQVDRKAEEQASNLAKKYNASLTEIHQGELKEARLAQILNNRIITRSGNRNDFSSTGSRLYRVQQMQIDQQGHVPVSFIDEVPLSAKSVVTGFSYVASVIGSTVVWHGRCSSESEQNAAVRFATTLARDSGQRPTIEEEAGQPGLFWEVLSQKELSDASILWQWKTDALHQPRVYSINPQKRDVEKVRFEEAIPETEVSVVDTDLEVYVVVPPSRRGDRTDISFGLDVAGAVVQSRRGARPVHTLIFPSLVPCDLKACFRGSAAAFQHLNEGFIASSMNVLSLAESKEQLQQRSYNPAEVADPRCLPLGLAVVP